MAFIAVLLIEQGDGEDLWDSPMGIAVLIVLDRLTWPAGLQHQRRFILQELDNPATDATVPDLKANEFSQLL